MSEALEKIERLIGASQFKSTMRELASIVPEVVAREIPDALFYQNYVFSIDRGCGLTTCLRYMGELLREAKIGDVAVEECAVPQSLKGYAAPAGLFSRRGKYLIKCIDIGEWINRTDHPEFTWYLQMLQKEADSTIYVFKIPPASAELLESVCRDISDILYIKSVEFETLGLSDMKKYAAMQAERMGFNLDDSAFEIFSSRITEEKRDGRFYGFNTVKKVVQEMVFRKLTKNASGQICKEEDGRRSLIGSCDIESMAAGESRARSYDMLSSLVGLYKVKKQVTEIIRQIKYLHSQKNVKMPCIHMRFVGNPGTGKTTVARIVGTMLAECGVLRNGGFYEYSGRSFVGRYIGETAGKTEEICRAAYGSVLFIDEAYSLFFSESDDRDFGREALSTLIAEMENHRSDMVVIMAGYTDEMETLMRGNRGLESRMPYIIEFENYTKEELADIFMQMASAEFCTSDGLKAAVERYFDSVPEEYLKSKSFSNGRFVRNLYERTQKKTLNRCIADRSESAVICEADFEAAIREREFSSLIKCDRSPIGF